MQKSFTNFIFRNAEQQRILWKIPDISQKSENGGNVITGLLYLISEAEIICRYQVTIKQNTLYTKSKQNMSLHFGICVFQPIKASNSSVNLLLPLFCLKPTSNRPYFQRKKKKRAFN